MSAAHRLREGLRLVRDPYHDHGGVRGRVFGERLGVQLVQALGEPLHLGDGEEHGGVLGLHRQHLALGVERGDLLLVAPDLLGQLLWRTRDSRRIKNKTNTWTTTTTRLLVQLGRGVWARKRKQMNVKKKIGPRLGAEPNATLRAA